MLGPVPLVGGTEDEEHYKGREPPWGVSSSSHILGAPVLRLDSGKMSLHSGLEVQWN